MNTLKFKSMENITIGWSMWSLLFDGKIGTLTEQVAAKRASKNRAAGTVETKPIQLVTKDVIRDCLINQILPDIREKWPSTASKHIYIKQNNAKPHINDSDPLFREAASKEGFQFTLIQQPPNLPDTNVNDLGWFRSFRSLQHKTSCVTEFFVMRLWSAESCKGLDEFFLPDRAPLIDFDFDESKQGLLALLGLVYVYGGALGLEIYFPYVKACLPGDCVCGGYVDPQAVVGCEDGKVRIFDMYSRKISHIIK
ncbi:hypothetical protein OROHE_004682 [Orobanche hederae]